MFAGGLAANELLYDADGAVDLSRLPERIAVERLLLFLNHQHVLTSQFGQQALGDIAESAFYQSTDRQRRSRLALLVSGVLGWDHDLDRLGVLPIREVL